MAKRSRFSRDEYDGRRGFHPEDPFVHGPPFSRPPPSRVSFIEEDLEVRHVEIQRLLSENQRLVDDRVALQRELVVAKEEIHRMNILLDDVRAGQKLHSRDLVEKSLKMEAELRATEPLRKEVVQLRADVQSLSGARQELLVQVEGLKHEMAKLSSDNKQLPHLKAEMDGLLKELMLARNALDYEKKAQMELMEQRQAMEKNSVSMAREVEKLRAALSTTDGRLWGFGHSYGSKYSGGGGGGGGGGDGWFPASYGDGYTGSRDLAEKGPNYGSNLASWGLDKSRPPRR